MNHSFERIASGPQGSQTFKSAFNLEDFPEAWFHVCHLLMHQNRTVLFIDEPSNC